MAPWQNPATRQYAMECFADSAEHAREAHPERVRKRYGLRLCIQRCARDRFTSGTALVIERELKVINPARAGAESGIDQRANGGDRGGINRDGILRAIAGHNRLLAASRMLVFGVKRATADTEPAAAPELAREHLDDA